MSVPPVPPQNPQGPPQPNMPPHMQPGMQPGPQPFSGAPVAAAPAKPKSRLGLIIGGVVGLAVIIAGVLFAMNFFRTVASPADALPGDASAVVTIQINPNDAKKLDIYNFLTSFPTIKEQLASQESFTTDPRKAIFEAIDKQSDTGIDYDAEIKPWLGDSIGVALTGDVSSLGRSNVFVAVHTIDTAKAKAFFEKQAGSNKMFIDVIGDFVVMSAADNKAAIDAAKSDPLSKSAQYSDDIKKLGDTGLVTWWANEKLLSGLQGGSDVTARGAMTLTVTSKVAEIRGWGTSSAAQVTGDIRPLIETLPASTDVVVGGASSAEAIRAAFEQMANQLRPQLNELESTMGIKLPDDLITVFGTDVALVGDLSNILEVAQNPLSAKVGIVSRSEDTAAQRDVWDRIRIAIAQSGQDMPLEFAEQGDRSAVTLTPGYGDELLNATDKLVDSAEFKAAVPMNKQATGVFYLQPSDLIAALEQQGQTGLEDAKVIQSLGGASYVDGNDTEVTLKLTLK